MGKGLLLLLLAGAVAAPVQAQGVRDHTRKSPRATRVTGQVASFTGDGAYDQDGVYSAVAARHPEAAVIVPPRSNAVPSETAETAPTQRDRHLQAIAEHGRMSWQKASGYNWRALVEADIGRWKTGHRSCAALANRQASSNRSGTRCRRPQPHAGAGTPELRPHRMRPRGPGITASTG